MAVPTSESKIILPTRRNFLSTVSLAAAGVVIGGQQAQGFLFRQSPPLDLSYLPQSWVRYQGEKKIQSYARYLESLQLKYVDTLQIIQAHAKKKGTLWNTLPPRSMWKSMAGTLKVSDRIGAILGTSVSEITSAYRCPGYNRRCPGAKSRSWHLQNYALDIKFHNASPWSVTKVARYVRAKGYFKGGIGHYPGFTHIDSRGTNVDW